MNESASAWARALAARFDGAVLRVEPAQVIEASRTPAAATRQAVEAALQAWCFTGARFALATLRQGSPAERAGLVEAFSRQLDGSDQLAAAGGALAGLLLRLRVKGQDAMWWRQRQPSDPWDAGYLIGEPQALRAFRPRRATLMVAEEEGLGEAALREAVQILATNSAVFHHPVRLLVLGRSIDALAWSNTPSSSVAITEIAWSSEAGPAASASTASASR